MLPSRRRAGAKPLAEFLGPTLDPLVARLGMSQATLVLDWAEIVGERLAAVCEPARLRWPPRGPKTDPSKSSEPATLMLRVAPGMGLEIQHLAPLLIERVNAHLGWRCVGKVALRAEPFAPKRKTRRKPPAVDPRARAEAERLAQGIEDEALRAALTRLGTAALAEKRR